MDENRVLKPGDPDTTELARRNIAEALARRRRSTREQARLGLLRAWGAMEPPLPPGGPIERIAILRPDHLGDLLFATPALRALRLALPRARITVFTGPWGTPVLAGNPDIDEHVELPFPGFSRESHSGFKVQAYTLLADWARRLRGTFDAVLVMRFDHWWGSLLARSAGIPVRVGYALPELAPFLSHAVPYVADRHEVVQNMALVAELVSLAGSEAAHGATAPSLPDDYAPEHALRFSVDPRDVEYVTGYLRGAGLVEGDAPAQLIAIHPGTGAAVKQWRVEAWAEVANALVAKTRAHVVVTGSAAESELCTAVAAACRPAASSAAGMTTLSQLAALYARCALVLGPDSGPLHLAVATGTPTVHLFGPADPLTFGPWGPRTRHRVVTGNMACAPCGVLAWDDELELHPCVRGIAVERVLEAALGILST